jgi:hypothetical protein
MKIHKNILFKNIVKQVNVFFVFSTTPISLFGPLQFGGVE